MTARKGYYAKGDGKDQIIGKTRAWSGGVAGSNGHLDSEAVHFIFQDQRERVLATEGAFARGGTTGGAASAIVDGPKVADAGTRPDAESNAEWDFMGRTLFVWSLGEMGLRNPTAKQDYLKVMDQIIGETLQLEKEMGIYFFLMPYARVGHVYETSAQPVSGQRGGHHDGSAPVRGERR